LVQVNLNRPQTNESGVAHNQFPAACGGAINVRPMESFNHQPLAPLDACHIDTHRIHLESKFGASPGQ
jgi:hypothetical protein